MTVEEINFAKHLNSGTGELKVLAECNQLEYLEEKVAEAFIEVLDAVEEGGEEDSGSENRKEEMAEVLSPAENTDVRGVKCLVCEEFVKCEEWIADCIVLAALENEENDEKIRKIKKKMQLLESGLDVDYRCVKCRECAQCKKSDHAEKIS